MVLNHTGIFKNLRKVAGNHHDGNPRMCLQTPVMREVIVLKREALHIQLRDTGEPKELQ